MLKQELFLENLEISDTFIKPHETITLNDILMISCGCSIDKPSSQERCPGQEDGTLAHAVNSSTHPTNSEIWYVNWIIYNNLTQSVSHKLFMTETRHTDPSHVGGQDCCEATCESWTCSDGLAPNPDKDCNMQSCGGEVNSSTWLILPDVVWWCLMHQ